MGKATGRKETTWTTLVATPTRRASEETGGVTRWPQPASLAGASGWYGRSSLSRYRCDRSKPIDPWVTFEPPVALGPCNSRAGRRTMYAVDRSIPNSWLYQGRVWRWQDLVRIDHR